MTRYGFEAGMLSAQYFPHSLHYMVLGISEVATNSPRLNTIFSQSFRVKSWKWNMHKEYEGHGFSQRIAEVITSAI